MTEEYDMRDRGARTPKPKRIIPDLITGQGDSRILEVGIPNPLEGEGIFENPAVWPLPSSPATPPSPADEIRKALEQMGEGQDGGGQRLNAGKLQVELLPPEWIWALADVMTQGAKKYEARNWEKGMGWGSMIGCIQRHVLKFMAGERYDGPGYDKEKGTTGCHHLAMAAWNCLALMTYDLRKIGKNDLADEVTLDLLNAVNAATAKIEENL
jgi:hypothetical protein